MTNRGEDRRRKSTAQRPLIDSPDDGAVEVTLYEAARRIGLATNRKANYTAMLRSLCFEGRIEIRNVPGDVECIRVADLPRLARIVRQYRARPRIWPTKKTRCAPYSR